MAPSPRDEDDNTPKAPDKNEKAKCEKSGVSENIKEKDKDEKTVSNLNDGELKALLDEAINYKNPKDREGKSKLFTDLLIEAEESERIARAASAGGSELVRHCNPSARRNGRHRRKPSSISENMMHGGSLDNLAKEELYNTSHHLHRTRKTVSARQREGGSLPCDVNSSVIPTRDYQFLEEARRTKAMKNKEYTAIDMESESLLEHDSLAQNYQEQSSPIEMVLPGTKKFITKADLHIRGTNVDAPIALDLDGANEKKPDLQAIQASVVHSKYNLFPISKKDPEEKKVDENGNALQQTLGTKIKKKKIQTDKNVVVLTAESVVGHRSDIINDVDKLIQYIGGDKENDSAGKTKSNVHKSKQLHKQHTAEDGGRSKKQRAHSSKGKESRSELKKSNSLGEISTTKLDEFGFVGGGEKDGENKVVLRPAKSTTDRPKERRSWGNVEPPPIQTLYSNASIENLETAENNWEVTKPKKKSKKRHNSIGGGGRRQVSDAGAKHANRAPSPDLRGKSACSVPHSEKSNDSSDVDSVHSLPIDGLNAPISYADIAKNSEKAKEKKSSPEKAERVPSKEKSPAGKAEIEPKPEVKVIQTITNLLIEKHGIVVVAAAAPVVNNVKSIPPPDVHNIKCFPAISNNNKNLQVSLERANNKANFVSKVKNVSPGSKNVGKVATGNNNVKVGVAVSSTTCVVQNDIQNDLSIIHSNEKESIQYNAQMLPPDIPDVQTIEKMHFLNRPPPPLPHQVPVQQPTNQSPPQRPPMASSSPVSPQVPPPPPVSLAAPVAAAAPSVINSTQNVVNNNELNINSVNCDSSERNISEDDDGPPPVVILSGVGNREVSGLVFGFDVNEQLLKEDVCENFISRYIAPEAFSHTSHNHDKIVNFIGSAWEAVINQSNGKVQYYTEES